MHAQGAYTGHRTTTHAQEIFIMSTSMLSVSALLALTVFMVASLVTIG